MPQSNSIQLDDKYTAKSGRVFLSGSQALVRLALEQRRLDQAAGLNTAGFISGYRGSPLGAYDLALKGAAAHLSEHQVRFEPGVNEDLAATAIWGTQQLNSFPGAQVDGVFSLWYGKGPGVDRAGDAIKHGNFQGSAQYGGVVLAFGDDHACKSSTLAHQSDPALAANFVPVLYPSSVQELMDFGLSAWALSRYCGLWVGLKCVNETVEANASIDIGADRSKLVVPHDGIFPSEGVNHRMAFEPLEQEARIVRFKLPLARHFVLHNRLDRLALGAGQPRLGIVTAGKAFNDVMQALSMLCIDSSRAEYLGLAVYKVAMVWPLEPTRLREFAVAAEELLFVEEKQPIIEDQAARHLYALANRPRITGKFDEQGRPMLPADGVLEPLDVARVIGARLDALGLADAALLKRLALLSERTLAPAADVPPRVPYFCSGCPHNRSTKVPDQSMAMGGIGCHAMVLWMDRSTAPPTHMGGEGMNWVGMAPYTKIPHIFQNMGDGTYHHSGLMAIRGAVSAGAAITFKILYNDAVAMTGGQPVEGAHGVAEISRQLAAEGVRRIAVVSDQPVHSGAQTSFAPGTTIHAREDLEALQKELRGIDGVSALIYDQTCAAELRRRRKRGSAPNPKLRAFINDAVCEGCGDCSAQSNCVSVQPLESELGRKRRIDQSSCNKDMSCTEGFCPSFVSVVGGTLRKSAAADLSGLVDQALPEPELPPITGAYRILVTGIGGTGVVTVGALLGMAAHLEGKGVSVFDNTGLAQKNGAVYSHLQIAEHAEDVYAVRIGRGDADLLLGCDLLVSGGDEAVNTLNPQRSIAVVNSQVVPTAMFQLDPDLPSSDAAVVDRLRQTLGHERSRFVDAGSMARQLLGDTIGANLFMVGYAWQLGLIPLRRDSVEQVISLNGVAVDFNLRAFKLGRIAAQAPERLENLSITDFSGGESAETLSTGADALAYRVEYLVSYQSASYARRYRDLVDRSRKAEQSLGRDSLSKAVTRYYFKLLAYKDEYEVARLYTDGRFKRSLAEQFDGDYKLRFHLAPPLLARKDPATGAPRKTSFGGWVLPLFHILARFKFLRGTALDPFGWTVERRLERELITAYEQRIDELLVSLNSGNYDTAVAIARIPEQIRGFGHVKLRHLEKARTEERKLLDQFHQSASIVQLAVPI
jgi:indolepyruvate ferredoxin oxidoreductase